MRGGRWQRGSRSGEVRVGNQLACSFFFCCRLRSSSFSARSRATSRDCASSRLFFLSLSLHSSSSRRDLREAGSLCGQNSVSVR